MQRCTESRRNTYRPRSATWSHGWSAPSAGGRRRRSPGVRAFAGHLGGVRHHNPPMSGVPPELIAALRAQRERWCAVRERGARRVGWKLGIGRRERIGGEAVIGYLTSATQLDPGATYYAEGAEALHADAEVAIQLRETVSPDAAAPQLA